MQRAMPTNVGTWLGSFASGWTDSAHVLDGAIRVLDQNPLGSAAGFGINGLQLDRDETSKLMGLARTQSNPMYCGLSRGMFENVALQAMSFPMVLSSRFATDMMMFTQQETQFLALPDNFVTGSSIMPQKKNYDLFEIMRANGKVFGSLQMQIQETIIGLGSGYHRDLQCTKKAFIEACDLCTSTLRLLQ
ncbi:argH, partial [Symbiodinium microadriaticum]